MAMSGFICHDDYYDRLKRLTNEEVGNLFRQLMLYHAGRFEEMSDFIDSEGIAFDFIVSDIERMEIKHNETSEINRINGQKGGRPKKRIEPTETEANRNKPTETEVKPAKGYKDKDKDKDKEKNNISVFFDKFWSAYPRHVNKPGAMKAFVKAKIDGDLLDVILKAIEKQKASDQWTKDNGQFIPHPATWLNQKRWEDELPTTHQKPKVVAQDFQQRDYSGVQDELMANLAREMEEFNARGTG